MDIIKNDQYTLFEMNGKCMLSVIEKNQPIKVFTELISERYPRIKINKIINLRKAFTEASGEPVEIGEIKPLIEVTITHDRLTALLKVNATKKDWEEETDNIRTSVLETINKQKLVQTEFLGLNEFPLCQEFIIAQGTPPVNGKDAQIRYYDVGERKPVIKEDGKADYYEMRFINEVGIGEWVGEKIFATKGENGKDVYGNAIPAKAGADKKLNYDMKTVEALEEEDKIVLYAISKGVVQFTNREIGIGKLMQISGDVGVKTGNIMFDGSVTIKGTVQEGYSVIATGDICIDDPLGATGFKLIESKQGDVFIKGGVFGHNRQSKIRAYNNIFVKHSNNCMLEAGGDINIGVYAFGSDLIATNVFTNERKGKIVGGSIEATGKVVSAYIGNESSRKTLIKVNGIDRKKLTEQLNTLLLNYKKVMDTMEQFKIQVEKLETIKPLNTAQSRQLHEIKRLMDEEQRKMETLDIQRKNIMKLLETKGEGQVSIFHIGFPETMLEIKKIRTKIDRQLKGTFYVKDEQMQFDDAKEEKTKKRN